MSVVLLCLAAALLVWPPAPSALRRVRVRASRSFTGATALGRSVLASPVAAAAIAALLGAVLGTPLVAALGAGCGALAARGRRSRQAEAQRMTASLALAETIAVLRAELQSGRSLLPALSAAVAGCPDESIARSFDQAVRTAIAGDPPSGGGVHPPAERLPGSPPLRRVGGAVRLSVSTGCSLAQVLGAVEEDLRSAHRRTDELQSATAGFRASAIVLAALPALGLAMGSGVGADPWTVLTTTSVGQVLLCAGVGLEVLGVAWVGRLMRRALPPSVPVGAGP